MNRIDAIKKNFSKLKDFEFANPIAMSGKIRKTKR
jgi:hypothetical protein